MTKIKEMTPAQEKRMQATLNEWLAIGRSTEPIDREKAASAIGNMYEAIGKPRPMVLFFSSPVLCILAHSLLSNGSQLRSQLESQLESQLRSQLGSQLESQLWSQLGSQLESQLGSQLESQLWSQLGSQLESQLGSQLESQLRSQLESQLGSQLESQLRSQLGSQLESQLGSQLRSQLESQLGSQLRSQLGNYFAGSSWCAWEVFYAFAESIGVKYTPEQSKTLALWIEQSKYCYWWFAYEGIVLASDRPSAINLDDRGRLHNPAGPAMAFSDGYAIHAVNGVRLPAWVIEKPESITLKHINEERNAEIRRVMIDKYGMGRYLADSKAKRIHADEFGVLYRQDLPDDEPLVMVAVKNSTPEPDGSIKDYFLRVPPTIRTAREAVAWTFEMTADEYAPLAES